VPGSVEAEGSRGEGRMTGCRVQGSGFRQCLGRQGLGFRFRQGLGSGEQAASAETDE
jgi:hypothetical protein